MGGKGILEFLFIPSIATYPFSSASPALRTFYGKMLTLQAGISSNPSGILALTHKVDRPSPIFLSYLIWIISAAADSW